MQLLRVIPVTDTSGKLIMNSDSRGGFKKGELGSEPPSPYNAYNLTNEFALANS